MKREKKGALIIGFCMAVLIVVLALVYLSPPSVTTSVTSCSGDNTSSDVIASTTVQVIDHCNTLTGEIIKGTQTSTSCVATIEGVQLIDPGNCWA